MCKWYEFSFMYCDECFDRKYPANISKTQEYNTLLDYCVYIWRSDIVDSWLFRWFKVAGNWIEEQVYRKRIIRDWLEYILNDFMKLLDEEWLIKIEGNFYKLTNNNASKEKESS